MEGKTTGREEAAEGPASVRGLSARDTSELFYLLVRYLHGRGGLDEKLTVAEVVSDLADQSGR